MRVIIERTSVFVTIFALLCCLAVTGCPARSGPSDDQAPADGAAEDAASSGDSTEPPEGQPVDGPETPTGDSTEPPADGGQPGANGDEPIGGTNNGQENGQSPVDPPPHEPIEFDEPAGITYANGLLYVADTNNHEIRTIDLRNNHQVATLTIARLKPPSVPPEPELAAARESGEGVSPPAGEERTMPEPEERDPRRATPRPPVVPGDEDVLDPAFPFRGKFAWEDINAEMPKDPDKWLNTDRPLKISDFRGKFVMLDFWTYCCINCIHILPEIKKLERAYPNQLVVIGVHSAKFDTEKETSNVREAVLRYEIEHPVVNDVGSTVWKHLGVDAWPTIMLIDPEGNLVFVRRSEWTFEEMNHVFQTALPYYRKKGVLDEKPIKFSLLKDKENPKPLNFPGKVLADEESNRLFIADSNNNRIVISTLDGELLEVIGSGAIGQDDGAYDEATFNKPQGMALREETLYVADTENHLIRKIDLDTKDVTTVAGTGVQGRNAWPGAEARLPFAEPPERYVANPREFAINSPWALWIHEEDLYIAMAGPHQIWKMPLDETEIGPYAGNGAEDIVDGPLLPEVPYDEGFSSFAQPSGLASDGKWLYVADSEGSSIRAVPFDPTKEVKTIIGSSQLPFNRLFIFANRDGAGLLQTTVPRYQWRGRVSETAGPAMQHCLGVVHHEGKLYVADTYNNSIKRIDLDGNVCTTIAGEKPAGDEDEPTESGSRDDDF